MERGRRQGLTRRRPATARGVSFAAGVGAFVALAAWFTYASVHAYAPNADGATVVLEGSSLAHGNALLHGWWLSLDSFWSVDALFYAIGVALFGVTPLLMHLVPAALAALCVVVGLVAVRAGATRWEWRAGAGICVGALVALSHTGATFLLQGPWHVGTALYCLLAALLLAEPRLTWRFPTAVMLLALGLTGDLQTLAIGVVPVGFAGLAAMARCRSIRSGLSAELAAACSTGLALAIRTLTVTLGAFRLSEHHHTVRAAQLGPDAVHFGSWITALFGLHLAPVPGPAISLPEAACRAAVFALIVAGVLVATVRLAAGVVRGPRRRGSGATAEDWRLDDLLWCMTLGAAALFFLITLSGNPSYARYLDVVVIFSAILAARVLPRAAALMRPRWRGPALSALGALTVVVSAFAFADAGEPVPAAPTAALEHYLLAHGLTRGIGDYWAASIVTVDTRGRVVVRPVVANLHHEIVPDGRNADLAWYRGRGFQFAVYQSLPYGRVERATLVGTFGPPADVAEVGPYSVVTWHRSIELAPAPFP